MIVPIEGQPGYWVSTEGAVLTAGAKQRHVTSPRKDLRPFLLRGYPRVTLGARKHDRYVHHLVLEAFRGPRPSPAHECRHLDGNPLNNCVENLAWGTQHENRIDQHRHGRLCFKLTDAQVREIRESSEPALTIAPKYGIARNYVYAIRSRAWRNGEWL